MQFLNKIQANKLREIRRRSAALRRARTPIVRRPPVQKTQRAVTPEMRRQWLDTYNQADRLGDVLVRVRMAHEAMLTGGIDPIAQSGANASALVRDSRYADRMSYWMHNDNYQEMSDAIATAQQRVNSLQSSINNLMNDMMNWIGHHSSDPRTRG